MGTIIVTVFGAALAYVVVKIIKQKNLVEKGLEKIDKHNDEKKD